MQLKRSPWDTSISAPRMTNASWEDHWFHLDTKISNHIQISNKPYTNSIYICQTTYLHFKQKHLETPQVYRNNIKTNTNYWQQYRRQLEKIGEAKTLGSLACPQTLWTFNRCFHPNQGWDVGQQKQSLNRGFKKSINCSIRTYSPNIPPQKKQLRMESFLLFFGEWCFVFLLACPDKSSPCAWKHSTPGNHQDHPRSIYTP